MYNTKMSNAAVNAEADALAARAAGGYMRWYDGAQPATADTAITTQSVVAELRFGTPAFGASAAGIITAEAITPDPAAAGGEAAWFRTFEADGVTPLWDGSLGVPDPEVPGDAYDIELTSTTIPPGVECRLTTFSHTVAK
jgi:hypothetical protein